MNPKKVGRKSIITVELIQKIEKLKNKDLPIHMIAEKTGVSKSTVYNVLKNHLNYKSSFRLRKQNSEIN